MAIVAATLRLSPERTAQIYPLAVTSDRMLKLRMAALGAPGPGDLVVFLHGALRGEHR